MRSHGQRQERLQLNAMGVRWREMKTATLLFVVFTSLLVLESRAGECTWGDTEVYFRILAGDTIEEMGEVDRAYYTPSQCFYCIGLPRVNLLRWGVAREKTNLFSARRLEYQDRLISYAEEYLEDPETRVAAATILAYQGIRDANGHDVFAILVEPAARVRQRWYTLASLQDPRAVDYAEREYREIRGSTDSVDEQTRRRLSDIVDCLFHLKLVESRQSLARLANQESDSKLAGYIRSVAGV